MHYKIHYSCLSHIGNVRRINQDNFICDGRYIENDETEIEFPLCGTKTSKETSVFGVFDGMGGEECGEIASYIASKTAATIEIGKNATADLSLFCHKANNDICDYANLHEVSSMGTTAAMLAFTEKDVVLCNIGDSKIFRLAERFKAYIDTHPFDPGDSDCESVLDQLYQAYAESHESDPPDISDGFKELEEFLCKLPLDDNNAVFNLCCSLCSAYERKSFIDGLQYGAHLISELR